VALRSPPVHIGKQDLRIAAIDHNAKLKPSVQSGVGVAYKMTIISFDVPPEVFSTLKASPDGFARELRLAAAIFWYQRGQISQEKAAQIAGLDRTDFLMALAREQVDAFQVDFDDLERELARG
jgi:hypothetical protein